MGRCHEEGFGVVESHIRAVHWFRKAAEKGDTDAQYNLGFCYDNGKGVAKDQTEAVKWYRKAAKQGNNKACDALKRIEEGT